MSKITGPLFKCFGSKWLSSKQLPAPRYSTIIEPFAGGAGYSLRHYEKRCELFEGDDQVRVLWRWLIDSLREVDIRDIPINVPIGTDIRTLGLNEGQALLLKFWQRTNNVGNCWTISKWGHLPGQWTANARARVAEQSQAIGHWDVCGIDWTEAFGTLHEATWFIDPSYEFNYQYRQPPINYADLALNCNHVPGQVLVCEADCPKTGKRPSWLPFEPWQSRVTSRRVSGRRSSELLFDRDAHSARVSV